jgi:hypothetical protein
MCDRGDQNDRQDAATEKNGKQLLMQRRPARPGFQELHDGISPFLSVSR